MHKLVSLHIIQTFWVHLHQIHGFSNKPRADTHKQFITIQKKCIHDLTKYSIFSIPLNETASYTVATANYTPRSNDSGGIRNGELPWKFYSKEQMFNCRRLLAPFFLYLLSEH